MASGKLNVGKRLQGNSVWRVSFVAAFFVVDLRRLGRLPICTKHRPFRFAAAVFIFCCVMIGVCHEAAADTLWYNGDHNFFGLQSNHGDQNVNHHWSSFVYDDFDVDGGGWNVTDVFSNNFMAAGSVVTEATWSIRTGVSAGNGGTVVASGTSSATQTATGVIGAGLTEYEIRVSGLDLSLSPSTHWLSVSPVSPISAAAYIGTTIGSGSSGYRYGNAFVNTDLESFEDWYDTSVEPYGDPQQHDWSMGVDGSIEIPTFSLSTLPTDLSPGDEYRLAFVTSTTTAATSGDINYYNTFVDNLANAVPELAALGTTWTAIASTPTVDAIDNTSTNGTGVSIYNLNNTIIADDYLDMWDRTLDNPLNTTDAGIILIQSPAVNRNVWTGTSSNDGTGSSPLGNLLSNNATLGSATADQWYWMSSEGNTKSNLNRLYAISGVLTVPGGSQPTIPEPSTFTLVLMGMLMLGCNGRRRRRR